MGFYTEKILPHFLDLVMKQEDFTEVRRNLVKNAAGTVLEVGFGSGLNLPFYSKTVERLHALDPSGEAKSMARKRIAEARIPVEFVGLNGEEIPLSDNSVDQVVTTWTLCTIPRPEKALSEIYRVLKPGGTYFFVEHGLSPDPKVAKWQNHFTPIQKRIGGGCHLNRNIEEIVGVSELQISEIRKFYMNGFKIGTYMYQGMARKKFDGK